MKRVFILVTATALLVSSLGTAALATDAIAKDPKVHFNLAGGSVEITIAKAEWDHGAKRPFTNRPKSALEKQPRLASQPSSQATTLSKNLRSDQNLVCASNGM
jgi:hypothetical protein